MTKSMPDIAKLLDGLDDTAQQELYTMLSYRRTAKGTLKADFSRVELAIWDGLIAALEIPARRAQPMHAFVNSYGAGKFRGCAEAVNGFLDESCGELIRWPVRVALIERVFRAIVAYLRGRDIAATPKTVLNSIVLMEDAVDAQFPGYARANLLHRLVPRS